MMARDGSLRRRARALECPGSMSKNGTVKTKAFGAYRAVEFLIDKSSKDGPPGDMRYMEVKCSRQLTPECKL